MAAQAALDMDCNCPVQVYASNQRADSTTIYHVPAGSRRYLL